MDTEKGKSVVSLRGGTLAVYLNTGIDKSEARIIGRNLKPAWQVYIILDNNGKYEYTSIGQADKKVIRFNTKSLNNNGLKEICGAAVGLYGRREFYEGFIDGVKKNTVNRVQIEEKIPDKESDEKNNIKTENNKTNNEIKISETIPEEKSENIAAVNNSDTEKTSVSDEIDNSMIYKEYKVISDEDKAHDTFRKVVDRFKSQMNELEKAGVFTPEEKAEITGTEIETETKTENITDNKPENTESIEEGKENNTEKTDGITNEKNAEKQNEENKSIDKYGIDYLFSHNEKLNPFKDSPYDWIRVCMDEIWLLPIDRHEILNPFVMLSDLKYSHLMLGRSIDKKVIVLAVPEKFRREDIKSAASFGFKDFWRCGEQQGRGVFGYWIKKLI